MIIQILGDKAIMKGGNRIVVSVNPTKPLSNAIPSILSKLGLTKKESVQLFFTTASTSLEQGLGVGEVDLSECTSSTGGLTISSEGGVSVRASQPVQQRRRFGAMKDQIHAIQPLPAAVDWTSTPAQMGLTPDCFLWVKKSAAKEPDTESDTFCDSERVQRATDVLSKYDQPKSHEWIRVVGTHFVLASKAIPPGQVVWKEDLELVESSSTQLVRYILSSPELRANLPCAPALDESWSADDAEKARALSQARMNGVTTRTADGARLGFAPTLSVFQRCCWPNAVSFLSRDRRSAYVVVVASVREGEELRLPWDSSQDLLCLPADRRNEYINRRFGVQCRCGRCLDPCSQDKGLSRVFYQPADPQDSRSSHKLASQVMREAHKQAMEASDKGTMLGFLERYSTSAGGRKDTLLLYNSHWRLATVRVRLLQWYTADLKRRTDRHLPVILLDHLAMETEVLPKYWPAKRVWLRLWKELLRTQPSHVSALLKRLARDRGDAIDWTALAIVDALATYWEQAEDIGRRSPLGRRRRESSSSSEDEQSSPLSPERDSWLRYKAAW
eukprot:TRINITY_DN4020_c2_g1_i9.p1 TRINITY_DN4020_c2_g1~~TRINITY_DN4020_c2_g1_i9.p1  ORF type:complete len:558 (+),score=132.99 TRINITY_DN4020_c2_g1_i9:431-2104(+)